MFDIREYYNGIGHGIDYNMACIDDEIASDIDSLLLDRVGSLYLCDRYKHNDTIIEIIYPSLGYPGNQALLITPDRLRFLLSFYPFKGDYTKLKKIVIRPRYIEAGNIELAAIYLKKRKILVLYLTHPSFSAETTADNGRFVSVNLENIMDTKVIEDSIDRGKQGGKIPHFWDIIAVVNPDSDGEMERFFIKIERPVSAISSSLNDISHFYHRHGY